MRIAAAVVTLVMVQHHVQPHAVLHARRAYQPSTFLRMPADELAARHSAARSTCPAAAGPVPGPDPAPVQHMPGFSVPFPPCRPRVRPHSHHGPQYLLHINVCSLPLQVTGRQQGILVLVQPCQQHVSQLRQLPCQPGPGHVCLYLQMQATQRLASAGHRSRKHECRGGQPPRQPPVHADAVPAPLRQALHEKKKPWSQHWFPWGAGIPLSSSCT